MGQHSHQWIEQLEHFQQALQDLSMEELAGKVEQLAEKCRSGKLHIAFCGHFSAGKSTLINRLCGASLLPTSPIPTSANIVQIANGEAEEAVLRLQDGSEKRVNIEEAAEYAKREEVREVELIAPISWLGQRGLLLDTPGVDSTDEAHRQATESALHLADVVVFVMDYNHVLSEMNLNFAKQLTEMGKPLILVVNQIDKHREEEVRFAAFRQGVDEAFRSWNAEPAACLYTSMKVPDHPLNEAPQLRALLKELVESGTAYAMKGIASAAAGIAEEARQVLRERHAARREELLERLASEEEGALERYQALRHELDRRGKIRETLAEDLRKEAQSIAENANITPASTRELVREFLESRQPGFRAGWWFASKKTEEEKQRRLEALLHDVAEHVTTQILFHVRNAVKKTALALEVDERAAEAAAEAVNAEITPEWLLAKVRDGVPVSGEYTLNVSKEMAGDIQQAVKRSVQSAADQLADLLEERFEQERPQLEQELSALEEELTFRRELEALEAEENSVKERLLSFIPDVLQLAAEPLPFPEIPQLERKSESSALEGIDAEHRKEAAPALNLSRMGEAEMQNSEGFAADGALRSRLEAAAALLEEAGREASALGSPFASASQALLEKAQRLKKQTFTVALFGAFSAGKSSFANALLGSAVLPVSPNPTTAAINTVMPPTDQHPHGTAVIRMKSRETVSADLRYALTALGVELTERDSDVSDLLEHVRKLPVKPDQLPPGASAHLAFVRAAAAGWDVAEPLLGTQIDAGLELFRAFVAQEEKSAFVEGIELYYDSAFTRQGMTLVDTPGADSINARHTGVTFNYVKNADAIFFVTYYNHAFSRADRQFLEQLGRVKDAFELDKMFFIVNAADLAADAGELQEVLEHVRGNLATFGIRFPRLFPVSSLRALEARQKENRTALEMSGLRAFEKAFDSFAGGELTSMVLRSADLELERTAGRIAAFLAQLNSEQEHQEEAERQLAKQEEAVRERLQQFDASSVSREALNELQEQLYYIKQRFQFRFGEWMKASFNPAVLREDRGAIGRTLDWAWRDLVRYIQTELVHEVLAAALRLERFMNSAMAEAVGRWNETLRRTAAFYNPEPWEDAAIRSPGIESVWEGEEPDLKLLRSCYKHSKQFFAGGGRDQLKEQLLARWSPLVSGSLDQIGQLLARWIEEELSRLCRDALERIERSAVEAFAAARSARDEGLRPEEAQRVLERIQTLQEAFQANLQRME